MMEFMDEALLLSEIRKDNEDAFAFLFKKSFPRLLGYAVRFVENEEVALDIVQECFLNFWEKRNLLVAVSVTSLLFAMGSMSGMNGKDMFMPMLKISLPIFRKKYNAQQRESKHYWKSSELKYENTMNQLQAEYIRITQQLEDAARKIDLYQKQYDLSLATYQLIVREFSTGSTTLTDVIQVERQMLDYHLKKSEAIAEYNTQIAGIEKLISTSVNE